MGWLSIIFGALAIAMPLIPIGLKTSTNNLTSPER